MCITCILLRLLILSLWSRLCGILKKVEEEEKERLLSEKKAIEEQKQRLEEDVRAQTRELKRSKQVGFLREKLEHLLSFRFAF
jgi:predicted Holliday junction resolvase-like endonuclease